jgi:hypothetical protein
MALWSHREPERLPDVADAARRAVRDIDRSTPREHAILVETFLGAAWPTVQAQNQ